MMRRIIEIPENTYEYYATLAIKGEQISALEKIIVDSVPLPEHHGRLIDADALEYTCNADECGMLTGCNHCQYHIVTEHEIDNAPTIIEADECTYKETGCGSCKRQLDCPIEAEESESE